MAPVTRNALTAPNAFDSPRYAIEVDHLHKEFTVIHRERSIKSAILKFLQWQIPRKEQLVALQDISFNVPKGQTVGVVGKNGQGKSTLLSLLARIYRPTRGRITVRGRIASLLELGAGFQPDFTGFENIYLNGVIYGLTREQLDAKLQAISDFAGISDQLTQQVKHYSTGMQSRLAFAIASHVDPDVLLVDEVLAVGDAEFQEKCFNKIAEFKRQGVTIFVVSHDTRALRRVCDRILWIDKHELRADGPTEEILARYEASERKLMNEN